jgi:hypothetical protein
LMKKETKKSRLTYNFGNNYGSFLYILGYI